MKYSTIMAALSLTLMAVPAMAHDKNPFENGAQEYHQYVSRADFLGLNSTFFVKTDKGVQKAMRLSQGQQIVTEAGEPLATLTGKFVVKLIPGVDVSAFAADTGMRLDWQNDSQLLILAASEGSDLLLLLNTLKQNTNVERVKLDRAVLKHLPM
ncbi:hypothetical protein [Shewanella khirikhana]|uniref:ASP external chaperone domain-containing protein n=1 Tax=Shewanella khirikhana TaxID=1965282 RepID=A0ABM7DP98_9GAMM|nr:hypothetical protein [Shewanella khirikhana]AZQ11493.1 hypothetical protein STH12_02415 [Shewanella khirikhana]